MTISPHKSANTTLELISVHIQKTAGRSFKELLKQIYGDALDRRHEKGDFFKTNNETETVQDELAGNIRALHGHFIISQVSDLIDRYHPKVVTWVRDPVDRVISNYYFLMKRISLEKTTEKVKSRKGMTLLEYAQRKRNINRMSRIMSGLDIKDYYFIGIVERFDLDIELLTKMMNWPENLVIPHKNSNASFKNSNACTTQYRDIDKAMRDDIAHINSEDVKLYHEVLNMRGVNV